jgi:hypothetical protein
VTILPPPPAGYSAQMETDAVDFFWSLRVAGQLRKQSWLRRRWLGSYSSLHIEHGINCWGKNGKEESRVDKSVPLTSTGLR